jgi:nitrogen regulatory protein PII-like uncharacterized protein
MSKMLRSLSTGKSNAPCHCCHDPYGVEARAIEKRSWQAEIAEATEERIIKLINDNAHPKGVIGQMLQDNYVLETSECQEAAELLIALIKREK